MVELNLMTSHVSKVFFGLLGSARTQTFIVFYFPRLDIDYAVFPFLIFRDAVECFLLFAFTDLKF